MIAITITDKPPFERFLMFQNPKLMRRFSNNIRGYSRSNITRQRSPDGQSWAPRQSGEGKMYQGMKSLIQVRDVTTHSAVLALGRGNYGIHAGQLAYAMHHAKGILRRPTIDTFWGRLSEEERAEWSQLSGAERLYRWGYKRRTKNGYVRASQAYLDDMDGNQQGLLLRKLGLSDSDYQRTKKRWKKRSLFERMDPRPFMGANPKQQQQGLKRAVQSLQYGRK